MARPVRAAGPLLAAPLRLFSATFGPLIRVANGAANAIVRSVGIEPREELTSARSVEELTLLIRSAGEGGELEPDEVTLLTRSLRFAEKTADDAMVPRVRRRGRGRRFDRGRAARRGDLHRPLPVPRLRRRPRRHRGPGPREGRVPAGPRGARRVPAGAERARRPDRRRAREPAPARPAGRPAGRGRAPGRGGRRVRRHGRHRHARGPARGDRGGDQRRVRPAKRGAHPGWPRRVGGAARRLPPRRGARRLRLRRCRRGPTRRWPASSSTASGTSPGGRGVVRGGRLAVPAWPIFERRRLAVVTVPAPGLPSHEPGGIASIVPPADGEPR